MSKTFWRKKPAFQTFERVSNPCLEAADDTVGLVAPGKFSPQPSSVYSSSPTAWPPQDKLERSPGLIWKLSVPTKSKVRTLSCQLWVSSWPTPPKNPKGRRLRVSFWMKSYPMVRRLVRLERGE